MVMRLGRHVGQLERAAVAVKAPAVIDAANRCVFVSTVIQVSAPMRAARVDKADRARAVAKGEQRLAHHLDAQRRAIRLGQLA